MCMPVSLSDISLFMLILYDVIILHINEVLAQSVKDLETLNSFCLCKAYTLSYYVHFLHHCVKFYCA